MNKSLHAREQAARDAMGRAYRLDLDGGTLARCTHTDAPDRGYGGVIVVLFLAALAVLLLVTALALAEPEIVLHPECTEQDC